jgi:16S rRNA (guanine527-N7)-methyltransferase
MFLSGYLVNFVSENDRFVVTAFHKTIAKDCESLGIKLSSEQIDLCYRYYLLLLEWNRKINLTSIRGEVECAEKLFVDSLAIFPFLINRSSLLDVASGAGFPGIALKIAQPEPEVHLVESTHKKVNFQRQVIQDLGLKGIFVHCMRLGKDSSNELVPAGSEVITFRAAGPMKNIIRISLPYLAPGGIILALKGPKVEKELVGVEIKGIEIQEIFHYVLPTLGHERNIIAFSSKQRNINLC